MPPTQKTIFDSVLEELLATLALDADIHPDVTEELRRLISSRDLKLETLRNAIKKNEPLP